jgi:ABC-2 type transport system permease protein
MFKIDFTIRHPFWVLVQKEIADHLRSWRFIILVAIILLTGVGSVYTALSSLSDLSKNTGNSDAFFFLRLFTTSDNSMPNFFVFMGFLGPLLGISMGFDAINSEQNRGTLSRLLAQPIHRDYIINAKFVGALTVIAFFFLALGCMVTGVGLIKLGIPPTAEEFWRIAAFIILNIFYVAFWLNLSILFSVRFRQPATAALAGIAIWLFVSVFYPLIVNLIINGLTPSGYEYLPPQALIGLEKLRLLLMRFLPNQLYSEATTTLLMPSVRSLGPLTVEQLYGAIPGPLSISQSLLLVWAQITGLVAATVCCFVLSYISFMKKEIRSR